MVARMAPHSLEDWLAGPPWVGPAPYSQQDAWSSGSLWGPAVRKAADLVSGMPVRLLLGDIRQGLNFCFLSGSTESRAIHSIDF